MMTLIGRYELNLFISKLYNMGILVIIKSIQINDKKIKHIFSVGGKVSRYMYLYFIDSKSGYI